MSVSDKSPVSNALTPSNSTNFSAVDSTGTPSSITGTQPIPKKSQQIKTDKPRPHVCMVCTRAFARLEHLKRHERSHTNEKPFQCAACGRCFARRDLVLRHQQKLHSTIPNIMRRGSAKENDNNEFIIVLNNNTEAVCPLPLGYPQPLKDDDKPQAQLYSPPKSNDFSNGGPQFRTALFSSTSTNSNNGYNHNSPGNIQSPAPSSDTPSKFAPHHLNSNLIYQLHGSPDSHDSPRKLSSVSVPKHIPSHMHSLFSGDTRPTGLNMLNNVISQFGRHASFSATSSTSYTNLKDAMNIQQHTTNLADVAPSQVDFATPQLHAADDLSARNVTLSTLDLNSLGMIDWNNIDNLDLNEGKENELTAKQKSLRNLQQFFFDNMSNSRGNTDSVTNNVTANHQFQDPNHPHHLKGTTPLEFGIRPPNDPSVIQQFFNKNGTINESFKLNSQAVPEKGKSGKPPAKKVKLEPHMEIELNGQPLFTSINTMALNMTSDDDWLKEIISTPYETNLPHASHQVGFIETPSLRASPKLSNGQVTLPSSKPDQIDEISSLFRTRQIDLVKQMNQHFQLPNQNQTNNGNNGDEDLQNFEFTFDNSMLNGGQFNFINEELRNRIILLSNVADLQFPPIDDLNNYMRLYELEFNKYFPFIHLPSLKNPMVDNFENIPLLLSMASIGALYAYHDSNTLLLFNLSKFHIQNFFEKEITLDKLQFKKVPLMAHQCLVLHIFISMFLNEPNMLEVTSRQMKSMIGLIKSTNFNAPLEQFLVPPPCVLKMVQNNTKNQKVVQNNFDYFIMAQSRIRTLHVFYMLQTFRSTLVGLPIYLDSSLLKSGNHSCLESLWQCETSHNWVSQLSSLKNSTLTTLSNGETMETLINQLNLNADDRQLSWNNFLALLMYLHEKAQTQVSEMKHFNYMKWKLDEKPKLEMLLRGWEHKFVRAKGVLVIDSNNRHLLKKCHEFKLILPLYSLLKIKLNINLNPIISAIITKNWKEMNVELDLLRQQEVNFESCKQSLGPCIDIIQLWVYNIETINYDVKRTSLRSPVFLVLSILAAVLIFSNYLAMVEARAQQGTVTEADLIQWLQCEGVVLQVERVLSPVLKSSYSEILTKQANGVFNSVNDDNVDKVRKLIQQREDAKDKAAVSAQINQQISNNKLAIKSLYLGMRILADAPVWPIAMGCAEALKHRATALSPET